MTTLDLLWIAEYGYVQFQVRAAPAGYTVKRIRAGSKRLAAIPGFENSTWLDASGNGYGEDYQPPMGATSTYVVCPVGATSDKASYVRDTITTPADAWLRDVSKPQLSHPVTVVNTDDESLPAYQHIYDVSGRRLPLVVHDIRQGRHGSVVLWVGSAADRIAIEGLLGTGNPLLLAICAETLWAPCMMAIGDATFARQGTEAKWFVRLDYVEVDNPLNMAGERIAAVTWSDIINGYPQRPGDPVPVTWDWAGLAYVDWLAMIGGDRIP